MASRPYSYTQTDFRGGVWSEQAQGRLNDERWKTAMNYSLNAWVAETGAWTRRPGLRLLHHTRKGRKAFLLPFQFGRDQAYQAEFTAGKLRFFAGLDLVRDAGTDGVGGDPSVIMISSDTPAKVLLNEIPDNWVVGDTIIFNITTLPPTTYNMFGRQYEILGTDSATNTITIGEPITGAAIDGSTIGFIPRQDAYDTVEKVLEYNTPYTEDDLPNIRVVQAIDNVLFLCPGRTPYVLMPSGSEQFTFGTATFEDGPYLDVNETVTTLTPSGVTGSITITASQTAGINQGEGFNTEDIGRLIRFQCSPPEWDIATTYNTNARVIDTEGNIYRAVKRNVGNDPTDDDGTYWEITADTVFWTWLLITARSSSTVVTCTVMGDDLQSRPSGIFGSGQPSLTPTTYWRLGVYGNRLGWPSCGAYHEGRLWLAGAVPNRIDTTMTFGIPNEVDDVFTFSPTYSDGTIADDSGLTYLLNSRDSNAIAWMMPSDFGLEVGTLGAEWLNRSSALDDPVTPTDVQARVMTTFGCANIEPINAFGNVVYLQARQRKVLASVRARSEAEAMNVSFYAEHLMAPQVDQIVWCQEPMLAIFARRSDGVLLSCAYKVSETEESFTGWFEHEHGLQRTITSISSGPNFQGTGDALYAVTYGPQYVDDAESPTNVYWVETIMPVASQGDEQWVAWHTDASSAARFIRRMIVANGDSFDGIRVFGLDNLDGQVVHPFIGGLDLGNFTVTTGRLDIPYSGLFTADFIADLSDGTDYGDWGMTLRWADEAITEPAQHPLFTIMAMDNDAGALTTNPSRYTFLYDHDHEIAYRYAQSGAAADANSIRAFDALTGDFIDEADSAHIFAAPFDTYPIMAYDAGPAWQVTGSGRWLFGPVLIDSTDIPYATINTQTLKADAYIVAAGDHFEPPHLSIPVHYEGINVVTGLPVITDWAVIIQQEGITTANRISIVGMNLDPLDDEAPPTSYGIAFDEVWDAGPIERILTGCRNQAGEKLGYSDFFIWGYDDTLDASNRINFYRFSLVPTVLDPSGGWVYTNFATVTPSDIDPGWTSIIRFSAAPDPSDGHLLCLATRNTGTGSSDHIFKLNSVNGDIIWNIVPPVVIPAGAHFGPTPRIEKGWWYFLVDDVTNNVAYGINTDDGSLRPVITGFIKGFSSFSGFPGQQFFDGHNTRITLFGDFTEGSPAPTYFGEWVNAHDPSWSSQWTTVWLGLSFTQDQDHREMSDDLQFIPVNFGVSYVSRGQLLPPDYGIDLGPTAGPAFGKIRRQHWWGAKFVDSYSVSIGTDGFDDLVPVVFMDDNEVLTVPPNRYTGIITTSLDDNNSKSGMLSWEVTRQFPCMVTVMSGYGVLTDK